MVFVFIRTLNCDSSLSRKYWVLPRIFLGPSYSHNLRYQSSGSSARIPPGSFRFSILSVSFLDHKILGLDNIVKNKIRITINEEVTSCHMMNSKSLEIISNIGDGCIVGTGGIDLEGCYGKLSWDIRAKCFTNGKPCNDFSHVFEEGQQVNQCNPQDQMGKSSAIIISAGDGLSSIEAFHPYHDLRSCVFPAFGQTLVGHSMHGLKICGGKKYSWESDDLGSVYNFCGVLHNGKWLGTNSLTTGRIGHAGWETPDGDIQLFGGEYNNDVYGLNARVRLVL